MIISLSNDTVEECVDHLHQIIVSEKHSERSEMQSLSLISGNRQKRFRNNELTGSVLLRTE